MSHGYAAFTRRLDHPRRGAVIYRVLAEIVLLFHVAFVLWVIFGGLLVLRWPRVSWFHLPLAAWGAWVEFSGWVCPLTPLEVHLRALGGEAGYEGGFIEHYLFPLLYPVGLTRVHQWVLGGGVVLVNGVVYGWALQKRRRRRASSGGTL